MARHILQAIFGTGGISLWDAVEESIATVKPPAELERARTRWLRIRGRR